MEGLAALAAYLVKTQEMNFLHQRFDEQTDVQPYSVFISAVDSMDVRSLLWKKVLEESDNGILFLDARMGADTMQLFLVVLLHEDAIKFYEGTCFPKRKPRRYPVRPKRPCTSMTIAGRRPTPSPSSSWGVRCRPCRS